MQKMNGKVETLKPIALSYMGTCNPSYKQVQAGPVTAGFRIIITIKGGSRRAEKSREVLMIMKAAKLGWVGSRVGQEQTMSRPGAGQEQAWSTL